VYGQHQAVRRKNRLAFLSNRDANCLIQVLALAEVTAFMGFLKNRSVMPTQKAYGDLAKVTIFRQSKFAQKHLFSE